LLKRATLPFLLPRNLILVALTSGSQVSAVNKNQVSGSCRQALRQGVSGINSATARSALPLSYRQLIPAGGIRTSDLSIPVRSNRLLANLVLFALPSIFIQ
jgi:hypothetical protein